MNKEIGTSAQISRPSEENFSHYLRKTIEAFVLDTEFLNSALVFPPCNSYFRLLIHQYVSEKYAGRLLTFSVGELSWRRTVVHGLKMETMEKTKNAKRKSLKGVLYVPPHARTEGGTPSPQPDTTKNRKKGVISESTSRMCDDSSLLFKKNDLIFKETLNSRRWRKTKSGAPETRHKDDSAGEVSAKEEVTENSGPRGKSEKSKQGPRKSSEDKINRSVELSKSAASDSTNSRLDCSEASLSVDSSDWESLYDDSGNSRSSFVLPEIDSSSLKEIENRLGNVKVSTPNDVFIFSSDFEQPEDSDTTSIIEIYGFPEEFKTNDLVNTFSNFVSRGFALKWVDNTHALGIFPTALMADEALSMNLPNVKTRPIHKATPLSREKAETLVLPSVMRPKTCSVMAKRLVSSALGLKQKVSAEEREKEKKILQEAREQRRLMVKQKEAAWEGVFLD